MAELKTIFIWFMVVLIIIIAGADLGMNFVSLIPGLGDGIETVSEFGLESGQIVLAIIMAVMYQFFPKDE